MNDQQVVIRADFGEPAEARDAMFELEGVGIDAVDINLVDQAPSVPNREAQRAADHEIVVGVAERYGAGALIGGVIGSLLAMAGVAILRIDPLATALAVAAACGGTAGFFYGGLLNVARKLPVNEDVYDTALVDPQDAEPLHVEVRLDDPRLVQRAEAIMHSHHALAIQRRS